jgi:hypothetical protein
VRLELWLWLWSEGSWAPLSGEGSCGKVLDRLSTATILPRRLQVSKLLQRLEEHGGGTENACHAFNRDS